MQYFITGTDTNIGKTVVSAWLVQHLNALYWKPIQTGLSDGRDFETVKTLSRCTENDIIPSCYEFQAPLSPHQAASSENKTVHLDFILETYKKINQRRPLIIEGAGGLMVPLNQTDLMIDLIQRLTIPVILVTRTSLGTLNHTLISLEALRNRSIPVAGVIAVGEANDRNLTDIEFFGQTQLLARLPILSPLCYNNLLGLQLQNALCYPLETKNPSGIPLHNTIRPMTPSSLPMPEGQACSMKTPKNT
ncbi:dethiobiotin synthase [Candidatus Odyssella acanthamoebae]|uniref:dethiobiotin synthase n=1 Tax=Candidatus Odyssella acanthamoebae TaxID=91604 RepID=UPI00094B5470|nr:dethiobiotin synthase [Candidatus Paracaedibacter acanthamoebae]